MRSSDASQAWPWPIFGMRLDDQKVSEFHFSDIPTTDLRALRFYASPATDLSELPIGWQIDWAWSARRPRGPAPMERAKMGWVKAVQPVDLTPLPTSHCPHSCNYAGTCVAWGANPKSYRPVRNTSNGGGGGKGPPAGGGGSKPGAKLLRKHSTAPKASSPRSGSPRSGGGTQSKSSAPGGSPDWKQDAYAAALRVLTSAKASAVSSENFDEAKNLKRAIQRLRNGDVGQPREWTKEAISEYVSVLGALRAAKERAVSSEDFDEAKHLKMAIERLWKGDAVLGQPPQRGQPPQVEAASAWFPSLLSRFWHGRRLAEANATAARGAPQCVCHAGFAGVSCERSEASECVNGCSGHGECVARFCHCTGGWYGVDCSLTQAASEPGASRRQGGGVRARRNVHTQGTATSGGVMPTPRQWAPTYVYPLPTEMGLQFMMQRDPGSKGLFYTNRVFLEQVPIAHLQCNPFVVISCGCSGALSQGFASSIRMRQQELLSGIDALLPPASHFSSRVPDPWNEALSIPSPQLHDA